jgi:hypothetical protein
MKIHQLLDYGLILTNEETQFVNAHPSKIELESLVERPRIVAQNLVRKGVYSISNDSKHLIKQEDDSTRS